MDAMSSCYACAQAVMGFAVLVAASSVKCCCLRTGLREDRLVEIVSLRADMTAPCTLPTAARRRNAAVAAAWCRLLLLAAVAVAAEGASFRAVSWHVGTSNAQTCDDILTPQVCPWAELKEKKKSKGKFKLVLMLLFSRTPCC